MLASLPRELRLIGGLAVMCRVGTPHRTTVDVDAVARDLPRVHAALARLAVLSPGGGQYRFAGDVDLDVIDIAAMTTDELLAQLGATAHPLTDLELNVVAHCWAHDSATAVDITEMRLAAMATRMGTPRPRVSSGTRNTPPPSPSIAPSSPVAAPVATRTSADGSINIA